MVDRFRFELVAMFGSKLFLDNVRYLDAKATIRVSQFRVPEMHVHEHIAVFVTIAVAFRHPGWWWQNMISRARQIKGRHANCLGGAGTVKDSHGTGMSFIQEPLVVQPYHGCLAHETYKAPICRKLVFFWREFEWPAYVLATLSRATLFGPSAFFGPSVQ